MNSQNFSVLSFIILLLEVVFSNSSWGQEAEQQQHQQQKQPELYNIQFNKPYTLNETIEVINPGTPQEELVVKGSRIVIYLVPSQNGARYAIKELNTYTADHNGYRVKTSFELTLIDDLTDKLGAMALKASAG